MSCVQASIWSSGLRFWFWQLSSTVKVPTAAPPAKAAKGVASRQTPATAAKNFLIVPHDNRVSPDRIVSAENIPRKRHSNRENSRPVSCPRGAFSLPSTFVDIRRGKSRDCDAVDYERGDAGTLFRQD